MVPLYVWYTVGSLVGEVWVFLTDQSPGDSISTKHTQMQCVSGIQLLTAALIYEERKNDEVIEGNKRIDKRKESCQALDASNVISTNEKVNYCLKMLQRNTKADV